MASLRSALLICAALTASTIAPAQAGPTGGDTLVNVANATLAKVSVPELLDPNGQPQLSQPDTVQEEAPADEQDSHPSVDRSEDLASMVADLRSSDPGTRELECLATGVYFESKGEPLAGHHSWYSHTGLAQMTPAKIEMLSCWENAAVALPKLRLIALPGCAFL